MVSRQAQSGFTLIELLLVVVLLLLFAGVAVTNLVPLRRGAQLREGVGQLETILRFARAEASQEGRRVQVQLRGAASNETDAADIPSVQVSWEPKPLAQPGVFVADTSTAQLAQSVNHLVRIEDVRSVGPADSAAPTNAPPVATQNGPSPDVSFDALTSTNADTWPPIMFYPDGSSDSVEILVTSKETSDPRQMLVCWNGLSGTATHQMAGQQTEVGSKENPSVSAQPLEPNSVAHSAMGQGAP